MPIFSKCLMQKKCRLVLCTILYLILTQKSYSITVDFDNFVQSIIEADIELAANNTSNNDLRTGTDRSADFQTFNMRIGTTYFINPVSNIFSKASFDLRPELDSQSASICDKFSDSCDGGDVELLKEIKVGFSQKLVNSSVSYRLAAGKIPAYADSTNISGSFDSISFDGFGDEVFSGSNQSSNTIVRSEVFFSSFQFVADYNISFDASEMDVDELKRGLVFESKIPNLQMSSFALALKEHRSPKLDRLISSYGISLSDLFYNPNNDHPFGVGLQFVSNEIGKYFNVDLSYYLDNRNVIHVGANYLNKKNIEHTDQTEREFWYLNFTKYIHKNFYLFGETNQLNRANRSSASAFLGVGIRI